MTETRFTIERLVLPDSVDAPDAADFLGVCALTDALIERTRGNLDLATPTTARLRLWRDSEYESLEVYFIRLQGRIVARAWMQFPLKENLDTVWLGLGVHPDHEGRGLGTALADHVEAVALSRGRTVLQTATEHAAGGTDDDGERLVPPTGAGSVSTASRGVRFALARGYELMQVERTSVLTLDDGAWHRTRELRDGAADRASGGYELVQWRNAVPVEFLADLAVLLTSMSTEMPLGGLDLGEEDFDEARVLEAEGRRSAAGVRTVTTAARHRASGRLAGYTVLEHSPESPEVAHQDNTLVLPGHRGHALGQWMKAANLELLRAVFPAVRRVYTYNADENRHMLDINQALGFAPVGHDGQWQRRLVAARAREGDGS